MWRVLKRNPFFLRSWWVWRRTFHARDSMVFVLAIAPALPSFMGVVEGLRVGRIVGEACFECIWWLEVLFAIIALGYFSLVLTTRCYQRERDLGTWAVVTLTTTDPATEAVGRWAGALTGIFNSWLRGWVLLGLGVIVAAADPTVCLSPDGSISRVILFWIAAGLWCALVGAIGLYWSIECRSATVAVLLTIATVAAPGIAYAMFGGLTMAAFGASMDVMYVSLSLPPSPGVFCSILWGPCTAVFALFVVACWLAVLTATLKFAAFGIRRDRAGTLEALWDQELETVARDASLRQSAAEQDSSASLTRQLRTASAVRGGAALPLPSGLGALRHNPLFVAGYQANARARSGTAAAPGCAVSPGLVITALIGYCVLSTGGFGGTPALAAYVLVGGLAVASALSFVEGASLGARELAAERDRSTWPLLLVTGMSPGRVLSGKLAAGVFTLSGEWIWTLPFWLLALVFGSPVAVLALVLVHPFFMALGVLTGLWAASSPLFAVPDLDALPSQITDTNSRRQTLALRALAGAAVSVVIWAFFLGLLALCIRYLASLPSGDVNPLASAWALAAQTILTTVLHAFLVWLAQAAMAAALIWLLYRSTERRLAHLMRGE